jgi:hypothetical protein
MDLVNENLVGRCGLYCGACIIYRAGKDSEKLRRTVAEKENCKPDEIRCEGWGKNCKIVKCLEAKRLVFAMNGCISRLRKIS